MFFSDLAICSVLDSMIKATYFAPRLLKTQQAACYLGISAWKLRNLVQASEIAYIPGDGTSPWLFDRQDLDSWIERRKQTL
jgi:excisionase family DNA binding protein